MVTRIKCPRCREELDGRPETFPFCSERCRDVDLGHWFEGSYVVSRPIGLEDDDLELLEEEAGGDEDESSA